MKTVLPHMICAVLLVLSSCSSVKSSFEYSSRERYEKSANVRLIKLRDAVALGQEKEWFARDGFEVIGTSIFDRSSAMDTSRLEREIRNHGASIGATHAAYSHASYYTGSSLDSATPNLHQYSVYFLRRTPGNQR